MKRQIALCMMMSVSNNLFGGNQLTSMPVDTYKTTDKFVLINPLVMIALIAEQKSRLLTPADCGHLSKRQRKNLLKGSILKEESKN